MMSRVARSRTFCAGWGSLPELPDVSWKPCPMKSRGHSTLMQNIDFPFWHYSEKDYEESFLLCLPSSESGMIILYCKNFKYLAWRLCLELKWGKISLVLSYLWKGDKLLVKMSHGTTAVLALLVIQVAGYHFPSAGSPQQLEIIACCHTV